MDGIVEQLVRRPDTPQNKMKKILIIVGSIAIAAVLFIVLGNVSNSFIVYEIGVLALIALIWGGWVLAGRLNVEYEYVVVGGEISVDKIFNKKSRKSLCSFTLRGAEGFYKGEKELQNASVIDVCGEGERYTIEFGDPSGGRTLLIFTPDERTLAAIKPYLPRLS